MSFVISTVLSRVSSCTRSIQQELVLDASTIETIDEQYTPPLRKDLVAPLRDRRPVGRDSASPPWSELIPMIGCRNLTQSESSCTTSCRFVQRNDGRSVEVSPAAQVTVEVLLDASGQVSVVGEPTQVLDAEH